MTRYILQSIRTGNEIDVTYDDAGRLVAVELKGDYTEAEHSAVWPLMPITIDKMRELSIKNVTIREVMPDLSFERFYKDYELLLDKKRAEAVWKRMSDSDKMAAITCIPEYNKYLARKGTAKAYPKTFLNNEYYNTDWKRAK